MIVLTSAEKQALEARHRKERDKRVCDRIKAVLLNSEGWSADQISQALRLHVETARRHVSDYEATQKLKPENGGSESFLDADQSEKLIKELESETYMSVDKICSYIKEEFDISYSIPGMTKWLHQHGFSYKHPKAQPKKADPEQQQIFIEKYRTLQKETPEDEPILFGDGVHPSMATKITCGWIRKGVEKPILTTASRTRMNLFGALNLKTMGVLVKEYDTLNQLSMIDYLKDLKEAYPTAPKIHLILDNGPYNKALRTQEAAKEYGIILHFLPPYSPNLNPIERLWKVMNEHVRNNKFFDSPKAFKRDIKHFFDKTWDTLSSQMTQRINDNFQMLNSATSG